MNIYLNIIEGHIMPRPLTTTNNIVSYFTVIADNSFKILF